MEDAMMLANFASSLEPEASAPITKPGGPLGALGVLPREIRDYIYEYVLDFQPHLYDYLGAEKYAALNFDPQLYNYLEGGNYAALVHSPRLANKAQSRAAILTVSKLIYEESYPVIFTSNSFDVTIDSSGKAAGIPWAEDGRSCIYVSMSTQTETFPAKLCDLPPRLKDKVGLIRHWTVQLNCILGSDKYTDYWNALSRGCDFLVEFLRENVKRSSCLTVRMIMCGDFVTADEDVNLRKNPDWSGSGTDCLLTLRDLSKVLIELQDSTDMDDEGIDRLSPEFHSYITSTLSLQTGTDAEPFKGYRYIFYEKEPESDDDTNVDSSDGFDTQFNHSSDQDEGRGDLEVEQLGSEDGSDEGSLTGEEEYNTDGSMELATDSGDPSHVEYHEHHFEAATDDVESQVDLVSSSVVTEPFDSSSEDEGYDADPSELRQGFRLRGAGSDYDSDDDNF